MTVVHIHNSLSTLKIVEKAVDEIFPNTYNPNRQSDRDFELLLESIKKHGFTVPILIRSDDMIVDGEHRWRAARVLGMETVPCVVVDMTDEQMKIATLRMNRARGSDDLERVGAMLLDLQKLGAIDWAVDTLGITDSDLDKLLGEGKVTEMGGAEYSQAWIPDPQMQASVQRLAETPSYDATLTRQVEIGGGSKKEFSMTARSVTLEAEREVKLAETNFVDNPLAYARAAAPKQMYNFTFVFKGEQAAFVRSVLGIRPADKFVEICLWKSRILAAQNQAGVEDVDVETN